MPAGLLPGPIASKVWLLVHFCAVRGVRGGRLCLCVSDVEVDLCHRCDRSGSQIGHSLGHELFRVDRYGLVDRLVDRGR